MSAPSARAVRLAPLLHFLVGLPEPLHRALRGPPARNARGDELDRELRLLCRLEAVQRQALTGLDPQTARRRFVDSMAMVEGAAPALAETVDAVVAGPRGPIPVRWYHPGGAPDRALVYLHGGGWAVGDLRTHDVLCRWLAAEGRQIVVAVDYALAPEAPFPAGLQDATAAFRAARAALRERGVHRLGIGGDSAGANLACAVCLALRTLGEPQPDVQVLVYPAADLQRSSASQRELADGYLLTATSMDWYLGHYGADPRDPRASVLLADLSGLAPAVVATAGFDLLRDEGEALAERLAAAGVPVADLRFPSMLHGFFSMWAFPACRAASLAIVRAAEQLRAAPVGAGGQGACG